MSTSPACPVGNACFWALENNSCSNRPKGTAKSTDTKQVLVVDNFDATPQHLNLFDLGNRGQFQFAHLRDYVTGDSPAIFKDALVIPPYHFYWLSDQSSSVF